MIFYHGAEAPFSNSKAIWTKPAASKELFGSLQVTVELFPTEWFGLWEPRAILQKTWTNYSIPPMSAPNLWHVFFLVGGWVTKWVPVTRQSEPQPCAGGNSARSSAPETLGSCGCLLSICLHFLVSVLFHWLFVCIGLCVCVRVVV